MIDIEKMNNEQKKVFDRTNIIHSKSFLLGRNLANGANRASFFRFSEGRQSPLHGWTPGHLWWTFFSQSGKRCVNHCRMDPQNEAKDVCDVQGGGIEECVKLASIYTMRTMAHNDRLASVGEVDKVVGQLNALIPQFDPLLQWYRNLLVKRNRYAEYLAYIISLKQYLEELIKTLTNNADTLDGFRSKVGKLQDLLRELKREYEYSDADCTGLPGYEKDLEGDGLIGHYYDNLMWDGEPIKRLDPKIRFFWSSESPVKGVGQNDFTVEWVGYLRPPLRGDFTFECETDDGCVVIINDIVVIRDNIPEQPSADLLASKKEVMDKYSNEGEWKEFVRARNLDEPLRFPRKMTSEKVFLEMGEYVKIKIRMLHSVHNTLYEDGNAWAYLRWESDIIKKQVVPSVYLFTEIKKNPTKPTGYDAQNFFLDIANENDYAFMDSDAYVIKYLPQKYIGNYILKSRLVNEKTLIEFEVNANMRVSVAYPNDVPNDPLSNEWSYDESQFALLKYLPKYDTDLEAKKLTKTSEDLSMVVRSKQFSGGLMQINLMTEEPMKVMVLFDLSAPSPMFSCAGGELNMTRSNVYKSCQPEGTPSENECKMAFENDTYWMPSDSPAFLLITFNEAFKPTKLIYKPDPNSGKRPQSLKVYYTDIDWEELLIVGLDFEFNLEKAKTTDHIRIEQDNGPAGANYEIWGLYCKDPMEEEESKKKLLAKNLGVEEGLPKATADCDFTVKESKHPQMIVICSETCLPTKTDGSPAFYRDKDEYSSDSTICAAGMDFYKDDAKVLKHKVFAVRKIQDLNDKSKFKVKFDKSLIKNEKHFETGMEVDFLDKDKCYVRGKVKMVDQDMLTIEANNKEKTIKSDLVFYCGDKLTTIPCEKPNTNVIRIKFCKGGAELAICKTILTSMYYFDTGIGTSSKFSDGKFEYGWDNVSDSRIKMVSGVSNFKEANKNELYEGSAAIISQNVGGKWHININNGVYDVKVKLNLTHPDEEPQGDFELKVNDTAKPGKLRTNALTIVEVTNLKVTSGKIEISRVTGYLSIIEIEIIPKKSPEAKMPKTKIDSKLGYDSYINCDLEFDNVSCIYEEKDISRVKCEGMIVKVPWDEHIDIACKYKCEVKCVGYLKEATGC